MGVVDGDPKASPCISSNRHRGYGSGGGSGRETAPPPVLKTADEHGSPSAVPVNPNSRLVRAARPHSRGRVMERSFVGIDVAKDRLDVHVRSSVTLAVRPGIGRSVRQPARDRARLLQGPPATLLTAFPGGHPPTPGSSSSRRAGEDGCRASERPPIAATLRGPFRFGPVTQALTRKADILPPGYGPTRSTNSGIWPHLYICVKRRHIADPNRTGACSSSFEAASRRARVEDCPLPIRPAKTSIRPIALKRSAVDRGQFSRAVRLSVTPPALVPESVGLDESPSAMLHAIQPLAVIAGSIDPGLGPSPDYPIATEFALVAVAVGPAQEAVAVLLAFPKRACVSVVSIRRRLRGISG